MCWAPVDFLYPDSSSHTVGAGITAHPKTLEHVRPYAKGYNKYGGGDQVRAASDQQQILYYNLISSLIRAVSGQQQILY